MCWNGDFFLPTFCRSTMLWYRWKKSGRKMSRMENKNLKKKQKKKKKRARSNRTKAEQHFNHRLPRYSRDLISNSIQRLSLVCVWETDDGCSCVDGMGACKPAVNVRFKNNFKIKKKKIYWKISEKLFSNKNKRYDEKPNGERQANKNTVKFACGKFIIAKSTIELPHFAAVLLS